MRKFLALMLLVVTTACQSRVPPVTPVNAVPSTPLTELPVYVALQATPRALPTPVPQTVIDAADAEYLLLSNLYERVTPSVVNVDVRYEASQLMTSSGSSGSGMVYDASGHIITNAHVVNGASAIRVTFHDGAVANAELVGLDLYSDLAVIRVQADATHLFPVMINTANNVRVGQRAIAIGNPFGLASSMTVGIVSGVGRQLPSAELINSSLVGFQNPSIIQVDTQINPGNSGGPLLNSAGEVIGINTAIRSSSGVFEGVGFAVPAQTILRVVPDLISAGEVSYSWIGISSQSSSNGLGIAALSEALGLPVTSGVLIAEISQGSPAEIAGLRGGNREVIVNGQAVCEGGDIIIAVNDTPVNNMDELTSYLVVNTRPGDTITVTLIRGEETFDVPVELLARPSGGGVAMLGRCGSVE